METTQQRRDKLKEVILSQYDSDNDFAKTVDSFIDTYMDGIYTKDDIEGILDTMSVTELEKLNK